MAIGHEAEIGAKFGGRFRKDPKTGFLTVESMSAFYADWKQAVGDDLQGGWARLIRRRDGEHAATSETRDTGTLPEVRVPLRGVHESTPRGGDAE